MTKAAKNDSKRLAALSIDCSFLLTHLIRSDSSSGDGATNAKKVLKSILDLGSSSPTPCLRASPVGWYSSTARSANVFDPRKQAFESVDKTPAVCFTESTLLGLKAHRDIFKAHYGLAFDRDYLFNRGANPCLNIREDIFKLRIQFQGESFERHLYNFLPKDMLPFINIMTAGFDATHEREWRYADDFKFKYKDVFFVFCPKSDFTLFSSVQTEGRPVLFDLSWLDRI